MDNLQLDILIYHRNWKCNMFCKVGEKNLKWGQHGGCLVCDGSVGIILCTGFSVGWLVTSRGENRRYVLISYLVFTVFTLYELVLQRKNKAEMQWTCSVEWLTHNSHPQPQYPGARNALERQTQPDYSVNRLHLCKKVIL